MTPHSPAPEADETPSISRQDEPRDAPAVEGRIGFVRPDALPGVEIMIGEGSSHLWRVYHETYTVCLVPGELNAPGFQVDWRYRSRSLSHPSGGALLMEPGEVHVTRRLSAPATFWVIQIDPGVVEAAARELGFRAPPHLRLPFAEAPPLLAALRRFCHATTGCATPLEQQSRLACYLRSLLESCSEERKPVPVPRHPRVQRARDYLAEHCLEPVTLDELERVTGLSRFHLVRSFAARYGLPPHAYQLQLRVAAARRLVRAGLPLAQVAVETGFADQSHLGRHFKRIWGLTMGRYRAAVCEGSKNVLDARSLLP